MWRGTTHCIRLGWLGSFTEKLPTKAGRNSDVVENDSIQIGQKFHLKIFQSKIELFRIFSRSLRTAFDNFRLITERRNSEWDHSVLWRNCVISNCRKQIFVSVIVEKMVSDEKLKHPLRTSRRDGNNGEKKVRRSITRAAGAGDRESECVENAARKFSHPWTTQAMPAC